MDQRDGADAIEDRGDADQLSGEETENEEDGEDMDGILRRLMEIRDRCHFNAKENIAAVLHSKNRSSSMTTSILLFEGIILYSKL